MVLGRTVDNRDQLRHLGPVAASSAYSLDTNRRDQFLLKTLSTFEEQAAAVQPDAGVDISGTPAAGSGAPWVRRGIRASSDLLLRA